MIKKITQLFVLFLLLVICFCSCGQKKRNDDYEIPEGYTLVLCEYNPYGEISHRVIFDSSTNYTHEYFYFYYYASHKDLSKMIHVIYDTEGNIIQRIEAN